MTATSGEVGLEPIDENAAPQRRSVLQSVRGVAGSPKFLTLATPLFLLILWQLYVQIAHPSTLFVVSPVAVGRAVYHLTAAGTLPHALGQSARIFLSAFVVGIVAGVVFGIINGWYNRLYSSLDLVLTAAYTAPLIVLLPLFIVWFGLGERSEFAIVFIATFFPVAFNATAGVRALDQQLVRVARAYGASDIAILRGIAVPATVPYILSSLRISLGRALTGLIFAEWFAGRGGLGYLVGLYGQTFQTANLFAVIVTIIVLSLLLVEALKWFESAYAARIGASATETVSDERAESGRGRPRRSATRPLKSDSSAVLRDRQ
jgi:ABC-type nitrate/sulfonate/bicarbonate transport system permease component